MKEQPTFADLDYQHKRRRTRREEFLERMDSLILWQRLEDRIGPHYCRSERGRRPYPLAVMLRVHIVQLFYNLSDPAMEYPRLRGGRRCCTKRNWCGALPGCGCRNRSPIRAPSSIFATCWSDMTWGRVFWMRSTPTWSPRD